MDRVVENCVEYTNGGCLMRELAQVIEPEKIYVAVGIVVGFMAGVVPYFVRKFMEKVDSISDIKAAYDVKLTEMTKDIGVLQRDLKTCFEKYDKLDERVSKICQGGE